MYCIFFGEVNNSSNGSVSVVMSQCIFFSCTVMFVKFFIIFYVSPRNVSTVYTIIENHGRSSYFLFNFVFLHLKLRQCSTLLILLSHIVMTFNKKTKQIICKFPFYFLIPFLLFYFYQNKVVMQKFDMFTYPKMTKKNVNGSFVMFFECGKHY
jgi:hypothetical protein